jgi:hypothetical protein
VLNSKPDNDLMIFQVLTATSMKMRAFWDMDGKWP